MGTVAGTEPTHRGTPVTGPDELSSRLQAALGPQYRLESELGRGSRFELVLPARPVAG